MAKSATSRLVPQCAIANPTAPPSIEVKMLSVRSCRISRQRPEPIARRTPISLWRAEPRASKRLATLQQAIRSTSPTTAISNCNGCRNGSRSTFRPRLPRSTCTRKSVGLSREIRLPVPVAISSAIICWNKAVSSALARSSLVPGFRRPMVRNQVEVRRSSILLVITRGCIRIGTQMSRATPTISPKNPRGATPIIVNGAPLRKMDRPRTDGSRPNRRSQKP